MLLLSRRRDASCEQAQQACRVPSYLTTLFGLPAPQPACAAPIVPACAENAGKSRSKVAYTSSSLGSAAPRTLH